MKNRKGFTLIEIIFVIAILGILVVIATPATIGIVKSSKVKIMKINENEVADASKIFANDYYFNPISKEYKEKKDEVFPLIRINNNYYRYVCLNTLKENKYLENDIKYADEIDCDGLVYYEFKRENELDIGSAKTFLKCGKDYETAEETANVIFDGLCGIEPKKVEIALNYNYDDIIETGEFVLYKKYSTLPDPQRIKYIFEGWYTDVADGIKITNDTFLDNTEINVLYAHWREKIIDITLDLNGGTEGSSSATIHYMDEDLSEIISPTRQYYNFLGWYTDATGGSKVIDANGDLISGVEGYTDNGVWSYQEDITLYAHWEKAIDGITITLNQNGATTNGSESVNVEFLTTNIEPITNPKKKYNTFLGWYTDATDGSLVIDTSGELCENVSGYTDANGNWNKETNTTLYAHWHNVPFEFTYSDDNGYEFSGDKTGEWILEITKSGTLTINQIGAPIDIFLVGGGTGATAHKFTSDGKTWYNNGQNGTVGKHYTKTNYAATTGTYAIEVGAGGAAGLDKAEEDRIGEDSTAFGYSSSSGIRSWTFAFNGVEKYSTKYTYSKLAIEAGAFNGNGGKCDGAYNLTRTAPTLYKGNDGIVILRTHPEGVSNPTTFTYTDADGNNVNNYIYDYQPNGDWTLVLNASGTLNFSKLNTTKVDIFLLGGGGGGYRASSSTYTITAAGGNGYNLTRTGVPIETNKSYEITVGDGGEGKDTTGTGYGKAGGASSFKLSTYVTYTAAGGSGGVGYSSGTTGAGGNEVSAFGLSKFTFANSKNENPNTGNGGYELGGSGGSGIVIIRSHRQ